MQKHKDLQDQMDARSNSPEETRRPVVDGPYIVDPPGKISDTSKRILEEIKVRRAEALRLLRDH